MAPPPLGLAQKGQCSPLYLLNQKESTRNIAWLSNWGYAEVVPHQCSVRDQMFSEIRLGKSRKLALLHYVLKSESDGDEFVRKYNQIQANQMVALD